MDLVLDEEEAAAVEAEEDGGEEAAPLPTEEEIGALEERLQELNVEYGLEDEEGDDEHREMAGLRQIYTAVRPSSAWSLSRTNAWTPAHSSSYHPDRAPAPQAQVCLECQDEA